MKVSGPGLRLGAVLALLIVAQVWLRPRLLPSAFAPDFLLIALLFFAIRSRPAAGAAAGFVVGLLTDAIAPTAFGSATLALTVVGYLAGWLKVVVFADNLLVNTLLVFGASWLRDLLRTAVSGELRSEGVAWQLLVTSPESALGTAAAALVILVVVRRWLRAAPAL